MKLKVPLIKASFYSDRQLPEVKAAMNRITEAYGDLITAVSELTRVNVEILTAMVFAESSGDSKVISRAGAVGLMQVRPDTAISCLVLENIRGRLSSLEKGAIQRRIGNDRLGCILSMRNMGDRRKCHSTLGPLITGKDLSDPFFNLLIGSIYLGQLIDQEVESGIIRFDRVVWRYNRGYFSKPPKGKPESLLAKAGKETGSYILKMVGNNNLIQALVA